MSTTSYLCFLLICFLSYGSDPDTHRNSQEMIIARGYKCDKFLLTTEDGYIIQTFRIPGNKKGQILKQFPVLLNAGIFCSSDSFLDNGDIALPYILADLGYDVYIMNNRGNRYSRAHKTLDPDTSLKYWDFSLHEMGVYDVRTNIEFIKNISKKAQVSYVGYSQGGGAILASVSEDPEYYKKNLKSVVLWGSVSNMEHSNKLLRIAYFSFAVYIMDFLGIREIMAYTKTINSFASVFCKLNPAICSLGLGIIADHDPIYNNQGRWEVLMAHYPSGSSVLSLIHLLELCMYKDFVKHRKTIFHSVVPYDLSKIDKSIPFAVLYGEKDQLVVPEDSRWLVNKLNQTGSLKFAKEYQHMGHVTFMIPGPKVQQYLPDTAAFLNMHSQ